MDEEREDMREDQGVAPSSTPPLSQPSGPQPAAPSSQSGIANAVRVPEGARFEYRFSLSREGRERHDWCLISDAGGINIWAEPTASSWRGERWFGGVEVHLVAPADYQEGDKPSQELCWLLLKPCWHDGSSLYFSEQIEPLLPHPQGVSFGVREHRDVAGHLSSWFRSHLATGEAAAAHPLSEGTDSNV